MKATAPTCTSTCTRTGSTAASCSTNGCSSRRRKPGIHGGSAFRAIAGYGRHGVLHEQHFFELAGDLTIKVEFIVTLEEAKYLLDLVRREKVHIFYSMAQGEFGALNGDG